MSYNWNYQVSFKLIFTAFSRCRSVPMPYIASNRTLCGNGIKLIYSMEIKDAVIYIFDSLTLSPSADSDCFCFLLACDITGHFLYILIHTFGRAASIGDWMADLLVAQLNGAFCFLYGFHWCSCHVSDSDKSMVVAFHCCRSGWPLDSARFDEFTRAERITIQ